MPFSTLAEAKIQPEAYRAMLMNIFLSAFITAGAKRMM